MLRVLIVEDIDPRQKILTSLYRSHAWVLVNTGQRAIKLILAYDFDIISLDYNLRGDFNGADVAEEIMRSRNQNTKVIIHSMNPKGAMQIKQILPHAVCYPISKMVRSNTAFKYLRERIDELGTNWDWA